MTQETLIHQESDILVTSTRFVVGGETMPVPNIVRLTLTRSQRTAAQWRALAVLAGCALPVTFFASFFSGNWVIWLNVAVLAGLMLAASQAKRPQVIFVGMADGGRELLLDRDEAQVIRVHEALSKALAMRV